MEDRFLFGLLKNIVNANLGRRVKQKISDTAPTLDEMQLEKEPLKPDLFTSLVSGATAGVVVDVTLYPLDTFKTRLQSQEGFRATGGFRGVYKGIGPVLLGSAPISAIFFGTYNETVNYVQRNKKQVSNTATHFLAASLSELICSSLRVPLEIIKQRKQTILFKVTGWDIMRYTYHKEGLAGLYRGFVSTVTREIPFAAIQYPLWEYFQACIYKLRNRNATTLETAVCGAAAGAISGAVTTPLDVIKTRIMLADREFMQKYGRLTSYYIAKQIFEKRGVFGFFAGIVPRVLWITLGGFVYFGMYELTKNSCEKFLPKEIIRQKSREKHRKQEEEQRIMSQTAPTYEEAEFQYAKLGIDSSVRPYCVDNWSDDSPAETVEIK